MIRGVAALLFVMTGGIGCARPGRVPAPRASGTAGALCVVRGRAVVSAGERLFVAPARGATAVARFTGHAIDLEVVAAAPGGERRAQVTVRSDGFVLWGWVDAGAVRFQAAREVPVDRHVSIDRGAPLDIVAAGAGRARIEAVYTDFGGLVAEVDCAALTLEPSTSTPVAATGPFVHLRHDGTTLFDAPGGTALRELRARRSGPTLRVLETRDGATRVVYEHGTHIVGWVRDEDLEAGEGPDCDDCYGPGVLDSEDRCPDVAEAAGPARVVDGCPDAVPPPARIKAPVDVAVHTSPAAESQVIGRIERGADVYVVAWQGGWGRVRPREFAVTPEQGTDFWVDLGELEGVRPPARH